VAGAILSTPKVNGAKCGKTPFSYFSRPGKGGSSKKEGGFIQQTEADKIEDSENDEKDKFGTNTAFKP